MITVMKPNFIGTFLLMVLLLLGACGKKTQEEKNANALRSTEPSSDLKFAWRDIQEAVKNDELNKLKTLIQKYPRIDFEQFDDDGDTLLIKAIRLGYYDIRNYLLELGVSVQRPNVNKQTALIVAVLQEDEDTVKVLLERKVQLNIKDNEGSTALHHAIKKSQEDIAILLIKQGASVEEVDEFGRNSFTLAQENKNWKVLELIRNILEVKYGTPDIATFRNAIVSGDINALNSILTRFPEIVKQYEMINPLALVLEIPQVNNALTAASLLLTYGANINGPKEPEFTPLIRSIQLNHNSLFRRFLEHGADPNATDKLGKSALIHAVEFNRPEMVWQLLSKHAYKSYSLTLDESELGFNACNIAKQVFKTLETVEERNKNREIRDHLGCRFWSSWFLF